MIEDRKENHPELPQTRFVFGPLLNSPPSHPDTVLTTMQYLLLSLQSFGMKYAHLSMDMQLYIIACQAKWSDAVKWKHVVLHPGMMHTQMSFLGCKGILMKASGIEPVLSSTFGYLPSILSGKSWPRPSKHTECSPLLFFMISSRMVPGHMRKL